MPGDTTQSSFGKKCIYKFKHTYAYWQGCIHHMCEEIEYRFSGREVNGISEIAASVDRHAEQNCVSSVMLDGNYRAIMLFRGIL